jgi:hypothetical protein
MADPKQYANMLREHARSLRDQLKLLDKREWVKPEQAFNFSMDRNTRFELATLSLAILLSLPQTVLDAPFAQFDLYSKPLKPAPHCLRLFQSVRYNTFTTNRLNL